MITKQQAQILWEHYDRMVVELTKAQIALAAGGVKRYTIDDRSLTRFDLKTLQGEIDNAVIKRAEYDALRRGRKTRKIVGVVPRNW